ncbi:metal-binding protein [Picosynechococcus sp. NKBG042902]|uniref:metal-binding protein n=1 Tax=Picosynechococcus sp. NKBG042902 TaxID=490193 RepID=UPI0004AACD1E|nr:metal-binding protein [Picosynechococcus sp. NKBG042902]
MPSGRTHDQITFWGLPVVVGLGFFLLRRWELALILSLAYLFSGLMFGPDLDIHSVQFKRWGIFRWIWLPYQKNLRHRSALSHGFLIGTIVRILYLGTILLLVTMVGVAIAQLMLDFSWNWRTAFLNAQQQWQQHYLAESLALFVGLEIGAMSHSVSDWLGSMVKRSQKQGLFSFFSQKKRKKRRKSPRSSRR